jgi:hypothetical protein
MNLMSKNLFVSSVLCAAALTVGQAAFAGENWVGSWKLNASKSRLASEAAVRAETLTFVATTAGIKLTSHAKDARGKPMQGEYTSHFDGKDVPWTGNPAADVACPKRIDDSSYENLRKLAGKHTVTAMVVVSPDGKTSDELEPGYVFGVVSDTVDRFAL